MLRCAVPSHRVGRIGWGRFCVIRATHRRLTYANVMATVAVFIALGGSALAAGYVITNSSQIKDGAVTGSDVKNSSLTGSDVKDRSLTAADFKGLLRGATGTAGAVGPAGPAGPPGQKGEVGARGPSDGYVAYAGDAVVDSNSNTWSFLAKQSLPTTGPYFAFANASVKNVSATAKTLECGLSWWSPTGDADTARLTLGPDEEATVSLAGAILVPSPPPIPPQMDFTCHIVAGLSAGTLAFSDIDIGALQVGALHN